jgi:hypothetical protein
MIKPAYEQLGGRTSAIPPVRPAWDAFQWRVNDRSSRYLLAVSCSVVACPKGQARRGRRLFYGRVQKYFVLLANFSQLT